MKTIWLVCSLINLVVLTFACLDVKKSAGQLNTSGVVFAVVWFIAIAPVISFCIMLYHLIGLKEKWSERDLGRKIS